MKGWDKHPKGLKWGYISRQMNEVRFKNDMVVNDTYDLVKDFIGTPKNLFVMTSNVDGLLHRNGHFPFEKVCETQGTYSLLQCFAKCKEDAYWPSKPVIDKMLNAMGKDGTTAEEPPTCPFCGGAAFLNVRGGSWYNENPAEEARKNFQKFVNNVKNDPNANLAIVEMGAGFNTPIVLRIPNEYLVRELKSRGTLIRINLDHAECPGDISALSISADLYEFLKSKPE